MSNKEIAAKKKFIEFYGGVRQEGASSIDDTMYELPEGNYASLKGLTLNGFDYLMRCIKFKNLFFVLFKVKDVFVSVINFRFFGASSVAEDAILKSLQKYESHNNKD
jgi:hypothetical protein